VIGPEGFEFTGGCDLPIVDGDHVSVGVATPGEGGDGAVAIALDAEVGGIKYRIGVVLQDQASLEGLLTALVQAGSMAFPRMAADVQEVNAIRRVGEAVVKGGGKG